MHKCMECADQSQSSTYMQQCRWWQWWHSSVYVFIVLFKFAVSVLILCCYPFI